MLDPEYRDLTAFEQIASCVSRFPHTCISKVYLGQFKLILIDILRFFENPVILGGSDNVLDARDTFEILKLDERKIESHCSETS